MPKVALAIVQADGLARSPVSALCHALVSTLGICMRRRRSLEVRHYRNSKMEIREEGDGWAVAIYCSGRNLTILHNRVPHGLDALIREAQMLVDRLLDGPSLADYP